MEKRTCIAKLDSDKVDFIRSAYSDGDYTQSELAKKFNVSQAVISSVIMRETWK